MQNRDDGNASSRQARPARKQAASIGPKLNGIGHKIGATTLHTVDEGQFVLERHGQKLRAFFHRFLSESTGIDAAVIDHHSAPNTADIANPGDHRCAGYAGFNVWVVNQITGHVEQFEEGHARVQQRGEALAGAELTALVKHRTPFL